MTKYSKSLFVALVAAALLALLTACGTTAPPGADATQASVISTEPIEETLDIDLSESTEGEALRQEYFADAMKAVAAVLNQGGQLTIGVFFSRGLHPVELLRTPVPTPEEASGVSRAEKVIPIREAAESALAEALDLAPRRPAITAALKGMGGESTDVAGRLAGALEESHGTTNPVILILTDGEDARLTGHYSESPQALAALLTPVLPQGQQSTMIAMFGIGATASGTNTAMNQRLVSAWQLACKSTGDRCVVSPSLDLDHLFEPAEGE